MPVAADASSIFKYNRTWIVTSVCPMRFQMHQCVNLVRAGFLPFLLQSFAPFTPLLYKRKYKKLKLNWKIRMSCAVRMTPILARRPVSCKCCNVERRRFWISKIHLILKISPLIMFISIRLNLIDPSTLYFSCRIYHIDAGQTLVDGFRQSVISITIQSLISSIKESLYVFLVIARDRGFHPDNILKLGTRSLWPLPMHKIFSDFPLAWWIIII